MSFSMAQQNYPKLFGGHFDSVNYSVELGAVTTEQRFLLFRDNFLIDANLIKS